MKIEYFIETKKKFPDEDSARNFAKSDILSDEINLHIHRHDDKNGENQPCELIKLK